MVSRWIRSGPRGRNWFDRSSRGKWEIWGDQRGVRHHCDHLRGPCRCGSGYHRCCGGQYFQAECGDKTEEAKISNKFHLTQVWTTLCCCCTINFYAFIVQHLCILLWTQEVSRQRKHLHCWGEGTHWWCRFGIWPVCITMFCLQGMFLDWRLRRLAIDFTTRRYLPIPVISPNQPPAC